MNQIEKVARAIIGPHEPVPASSRYTLDELREVRWRQITSDERSMALREAKAALAAMQPAPQEPVAWMYQVRRVTNFSVSRARDTFPEEQGWTETPLYAHPPAQWQGIESAPDLERVIVAGWNFHSDNVRGYWWYGEDVVSNGRAIEHPRATHWRPFNNPAFPTPPAGGSDAE